MIFTNKSSYAECVFFFAKLFSEAWPDTFCQETFIEHSYNYRLYEEHFSHWQSFDAKFVLEQTANVEIISKESTDSWTYDEKIVFKVICGELEGYYSVECGEGSHGNSYKIDYDTLRSVAPKEKTIIVYETVGDE